MARKQTRNNWYDLFLNRIDSIWGRLGVIMTIFIVGFKCGIYYKETLLIKENNQRDVDYYIQLSSQIEKFNDKENDYKKVIDDLRLERLDLKSQIIGLTTEIQELHKKQNHK